MKLHISGMRKDAKERERKVSREPDIERFPVIYYDLFHQLARMSSYPFLFPNIPKKIVNLMNIMLPILKEPREGAAGQICKSAGNRLSGRKRERVMKRE